MKRIVLITALLAGGAFGTLAFAPPAYACGASCDCAKKGHHHNKNNNAAPEAPSPTAPDKVPNAAPPAKDAEKHTDATPASDCKCEKGGKNCTCKKNECKCANCGAKLHASGGELAASENR